MGWVGMKVVKVNGGCEFSGGCDTEKTFGCHRCMFNGMSAEQIQDALLSEEARSFNSQAMYEAGV